MLTVENITKSLGTFTLNEICMNVEHNDYYVLVGESGAGKSLLLDIIAGLVLPDSGKILLNGNDITHAKIQHRGVGLVMQENALFPHLTVFHNIAYPLKCRNEKVSRISNEVQKHAKKLNIATLLDRKTVSLSGGESQRVALARTLISKPDILLLDEPMASVDASLKKDIRLLLRSIHAQGIPVIHVTHDYDEAISLASKIGVINQGNIVQTGTPTDIFNHPKNDFIADLAGIKNFIPVYILPSTDNNNLKIAKTNGIHIKLQTESSGAKGYLIIPPDRIILSHDEIESSAQNRILGTVQDIMQSPYGYEITIDIGVRLFSSITRASFEELTIKRGDRLWANFKAGAVKFIEKS